MPDNTPIFVGITLTGANERADLDRCREVLRIVGNDMQTNEAAVAA